MRRLLALALALAATPALAEADLSGTWMVARPVAALLTADGKAPPLRPAAKALHDKRVAAARASDRSWDPAANCKPLGEPRALVEQGWPFELMQSPGRVDFLFQWNRLDRSVLIVPTQPDFGGPYYMGQSIGRWEGDTLVVDLIGEDEATMLDPSGLPHSDDMTIVERFRLRPDGMLEARLRITDPATYTAPWDATLLFRRAPKGTQIKEDVCFERTHDGKYATLQNSLAD